MTVLTKLPPDLLTIPQAAARLGVSPDTAYAMARDGELPGAFRVRGQWRVSAVRLDRHIHGESS